MCLVVFERLIAPVEAVLAAVAVPVRALDLLAALDRPDEVTPVTAAHYLQPCGGAAAPLWHLIRLRPTSATANQQAQNMTQS